MSQREALFTTLIFNEEGQPVETTRVGDDPCYVVPDGDFLRHVDAAEVDRQVLLRIKERLLEMKDAVVEGVMQMTGSDDPFSRAAIEMSLENLERLLEMPPGMANVEDLRLGLWMSGFRVTVNLHGEVVHVELPGLEG